MSSTHLACNSYAPPPIYIQVYLHDHPDVSILGGPPYLLQVKWVDGSGTKTWAKWTNKRLDTYALEAR